MRSGKQLAQIVRGLDGKGYRAYKGIRGSYAFGDFELHIEHVQVTHSRSLLKSASQLPPRLRAYPRMPSTMPWVDAQLRLLNVNSAGDFEHSTRSGSGKSGLIEMLEPGQRVGAV